MALTWCALIQDSLLSTILKWQYLYDIEGFPILNRARGEWGSGQIKRPLIAERPLLIYNPKIKLGVIIVTFFTVIGDVQATGFFFFSGAKTDESLHNVSEN